MVETRSIRFAESDVHSEHRSQGRTDPSDWPLADASGEPLA
jgi:hypothetical protein